MGEWQTWHNLQPMKTACDLYPYQPTVTTEIDFTVNIDDSHFEHSVATHLVVCTIMYHHQLDLRKAMHDYEYLEILVWSTLPWDGK